MLCIQHVKTTTHIHSYIYIQTFGFMFVYVKRENMMFPVQKDKEKNTV